MKIERITTDKIRVFLNLEDLQQEQVDLHTFMSSPIESQKLFLNVLEKAEKEYGFSTKDYKIILEAIVTSEFNFILTVTRLPYINKIDYKKNHIKFKRKLPSTRNSSLIYAFSSFDDFCDFSSNTNYTDFNKMCKNICLYYLDDTYYLLFSKIYPNSIQFTRLCSFISEFATPVLSSELFERKLLEYGKIIIKNNAINVCNKFFNKSV